MRIMTGLLMCVLAGAFSGCGEVVDTSALPPLTGYTDWYQVDSTGPIAGHGDTYRIIYANDQAREYGGAGQYRNGTVLVKEIRENLGGEPGDILYYAIMRKLGQAPPGGTLEGGWLFTITDQLGDQLVDNEKYGPSCWNTCHVQAPIDGAWIDYGR
jgi:hypothetical protein